MNRKTPKVCKSHLFAQRHADRNTSEAFKLIDAENEILDRQYPTFISTMQQVENMLVKEFKSATASNDGEF